MLLSAQAASCHVSTKDVRSVEILTLEILDLEVESAHPWTCEMISLEHAESGETRYFPYDRSPAYSLHRTCSLGFAQSCGFD